MHLVCFENGDVVVVWMDVKAQAPILLSFNGVHAFV